MTLFILIVFVALGKKIIISIRSKMLFQKLARYLSQKEFVKSAIEEGADLSIFRQRPGVRGAGDFCPQLYPGLASGGLLGIPGHVSQG